MTGSAFVTWLSVDVNEPHPATVHARTLTGYTVAAVNPDRVTFALVTVWLRLSPT